MYWKIWPNLILLFVSLSTKKWFVVIGWPQCAEFRFQSTDTDKSLNSMEKEFKQRIPKLFDSYDVGNYSGVERTLHSLQPLKQPTIQTFQRQESATSQIVEQIENDGYPSTVHHVITQDGYILELHRLGNDTSDSDSNLNGKRIPVFLMHGLLESSNGWIALGPEHSLAYLLYDNGYDVWLGNARGTRSSQKHIYLSSTGRRRKEYWSFSLHEIGIYDLPASIDHILEETNQTQLHYVGFSQGTTVFFIMTSELPEYNEKITSMIALAPIAYMKHSENYLLHILDSYNTLIRRILNYMEYYSVDPGNRALSWIAEFACRQIDNKSPVPCQFILYCLDSNQINCTSLPRIVKHIPNTASIRQLYHFAQLKNTGKFQQYDYLNTKLNVKYYGSPQPPSYNLSSVTAPITILYSHSDESANFTDVEYLSTKLPNLRGMFQIPSNDFKHIDFIYSRFVRKLVNDNVLYVLNRDRDSNRNEIETEAEAGAETEIKTETEPESEIETENNTDKEFETDASSNSTENTK